MLESTPYFYQEKRRKLHADEMIVGKPEETIARFYSMQMKYFYKPYQYCYLLINYNDTNYIKFLIFPKM